MPRSLKKGPFVDLSLSKKVDAAIANNDKSFDGGFNHFSS